MFLFFPAAATVIPDVNGVPAVGELPAGYAMAIIILRRPYCVCGPVFCRHSCCYGISCCCCHTCCLYLASIMLFAVILFVAGVAVLTALFAAFMLRMVMLVLHKIIKRKNGK
jgi:hypothetical protein